MRDSDVRAAVLDRLNNQYAGDHQTRVVQEMGLWSGTVRIDIAIINGELIGIELKSDRDTLERLPFQAEIYSQIFDRMELVVGARHAEKATAHVPHWWDITVASREDGRIRLSHERKGDRNPAPNALLLAQLLWKDEALAVLDAEGLANGWRSKRAKLIHQRLASELPFDVLSKYVREGLKRRSDWLRQNLSRQLDMSVHTNLHPAFEIPARFSSSRNVINAVVGPAVGEQSSISVSDDGARVAKELLVHIDAAETSSADAPTNKEVMLQGITYIDRETPRNALRRGIWRYGSVVAVLKRVWQSVGCKPSPKG